MLKFVFLLTLYNAGAPQVHVMDSGLSGSDCLAKVEAYAVVDPGFDVGMPACKPDMAAEGE